MHYYEKNIVDIKHEYTQFLTHIMTPLIYEGIKSMYNKALEAEKKYMQLAKDDSRIKNPGVLKIFQHFLKGIPSLNINLIEAEMIRIRDSSKHADIFEKLIKAVIKSTIIVLTYNSSGQQCKIVNEKIHEKIDSKEFIHKIYVECAKQFYANPELYWHQYQSIELKRNQQQCFDIINKSISIAIKQSIPMNDILEEYLKNDYIIETEEEKIKRLRDMINGNAEDKLNYFDDNDKKVLITDNEFGNSEINEDFNVGINEEINDEISKNIFDLDKLINNDNGNITSINEQSVNQNAMKNTKIVENISVKADDTEKDFAEKLAKVDLYSKQKIRSQMQSQMQQIQPEPQNAQNLMADSVSDNIEIIKEKQNINVANTGNTGNTGKPVDERGYFNAMFN